MARLVVEKGPDQGMEFELGDKTTLGRRSECDLPIRDMGASRVHAEILKKGKDFIIHDLKSKNGTLVNGEAVEERWLIPGDRVMIGHTLLAFFLDKPRNRWVGRQLEGYQILEFISEGGMGSVYKARQISMDRLVAIKILNEKLVQNKDFIERFLLEAKAAGRLNHVHIIQVYEVGMNNGTYYFSMEFVDGPTVGRLLRDKGRILVEDSLDIIGPIAEALDFAHKNSLIHRDIKPENIMICSTGQVKLADLGLARNPKDEMVDLVDGKKIVWGTPSYMSPEQAMGHNLDGRSDLYSLGATWYHMIAGNPPFAGNTDPEIMGHHISTPVPSLSDKITDISRDVVAILERLLKKQPEERYQSGEELARDIAACRSRMKGPGGGENLPISGPGRFKKLLAETLGFKKKE